MVSKKSSKTKNKNVFRLKLPAESENLDIIRKFISGIAANMGFTEDDIYQIELAVDEACANIINHAYDGHEEGGKEPLINVTVRSKPDRIEITIADRGIGFDPQTIQSPDMEAYLRDKRRGGLGVHLIRTLMDDVHFRMKPGVRNEVKMVKHLSI